MKRVERAPNSVSGSLECRARPLTSRNYAVISLVGTTIRLGASVWWSQAGSNRRPLACHASALPAELWPHLLPRERGGSRIIRRVVAPGGCRAPNGRPVRGARVWHISLRASSAPRRIFTGMGKRGPAAPARSAPARPAPPRNSTSSGYLHCLLNLFLMGNAYDPRHVKLRMAWGN
ncbi:MAG: hypothetical protein FD152_3657 [Xanthobacteraceae bacterium]|nr:MAG: hypothetical protein FD152_3657 [Xanthobacteraceae bacterium]